MTEQIRGGTIEHWWEKYYSLKEGDVYVEFGGFWARYACVASRKKCSKIVLVEPSPFNQSKIEEAIREEPLQNVVLIKKAVSDRKGTAQFVTWGNPSGHRLSRYEGDYPGDRVDVETDTSEGILDSAGIDHVDLLAADCEASETDLVKYLGKWLSEKKVKHLAIGAYHTPTNPEQIMKFLQSHDYKNVCYEEGVVYADA